MEDFNTLWNFLTTIVLAALGFGLKRFQIKAETIVKTEAQEGVKAAFKELNWSTELARELQKTRGVQRQELRYKSYATLWEKLRPLAIYDDTTINNAEADELLNELSNWYFSESGGLFLTPQARGFYFALQDLLRATSSLSENWKADRSGESAGVQSAALEKLFDQYRCTEAIEVLMHFKDESAGDAYWKDWPTKGIDLGAKWRAGIKTLSEKWSDLGNSDRFVILQQVGSKLRSSLTIDLESRLD